MATTTYRRTLSSRLPGLHFCQAACRGNCQNSGRLPRHRHQPPGAQGSAGDVDWQRPKRGSQILALCSE